MTNRPFDDERLGVSGEALPGTGEESPEEAAALDARALRWEQLRGESGPPIVHSPRNLPRGGVGTTMANPQMDQIHMQRLAMLQERRLLQDGEEMLESGLVRDETLAKAGSGQMRNAGEGTLIATDRRLIFLADANAYVTSWPYQSIHGHDVRRAGRFGPMKRMAVLSLRYATGDLLELTGGQNFMSSVHGILVTKQGCTIKMQTTCLSVDDQNGLTCTHCGRIYLEREAVATCRACGCTIDWKGSAGAVDVHNAREQ